MRKLLFSATAEKVFSARCGPWAVALGKFSPNAPPASVALVAAACSFVAARMIPTDFSVLLLAWDDADPGVAVLGGSALPPTLPLVYQLAAQHPVLAVYPHLPPTETTAALEADVAEVSAPVGASTPADAPARGGAAADYTTAASALVAVAAEAAGAATSPLDAAADAPGVHLLAPALAPAVPGASGRLALVSSRLVGLDDLTPVIQRALPTAHSLTPASVAAPGAGISRGATVAPSTAARSQWPAEAGLLQAASSWQAPAAPYAGATEEPYAAGATIFGTVAASPNSPQTPSYATTRPVFPPPPPAPPRLAAVAAAPVSAATPGAAVGAAAAPALSVSPAPNPAPPAAAHAEAGPRPETAVPAVFDEPVVEIGAAEANDLSAPEDDLVPDALPSAAAPAAAETVAPEAAAAVAATAAPEPAAWAVRQPALDGLNFRMIQYARRAAQLVDSRQDFGVIYAPGWPAWLAALEIRNRTGRPLVLYVPALASDTAPAADRGWLLGVERMALRRATLVLVPNGEVLHQLRSCHPDVPGEVRIVPAADEAAVLRVLAEVALN